jgi:tetratricopeptide (TPR) repeat protein
MRGWVFATSLLVAVCGLVAAAAAQTDEETELLIVEAKRALAKKKYDGAADLLDRALRQNPRRIDAYVLRASIHLVRKEHDRGVTLLRRAQALAPDNLEVLTALGTQLVLSGKTGDGVALLEKVVAREPRRWEAQAVLGHHYAQTGRHEEAIASLTTYLAERPAELAAEDPSHLTELAAAHLYAGDAAKARELYARVLRADGDDAQARLGLIWSTAAIDCREAEALYRRDASLARTYPELWLVQGRCALELGKAKEALAAVDRYLSAAKTESAAALALRGEALAETGDRAGALAALARAAELEPKDPRHVVRLARTERRSGSIDDAIRRLEGLAHPADERDRRDLAIELGECYLAAERGDDAIRLLAPWASAHADDARAREVLAEAQLWFGGAGGVDLAVRLVETSTTARGRRILEDAYNAKGVALLRSGDFAAAEAYLGKAVELGTRMTSIVNLGVALLELGRPADVVTLGERFGRRQADPEWVDFLPILARAHVAQGDVAAARTLLQAGLGDEAPRKLVVELAAIEMDAGEPAAAAARLERLVRNGDTSAAPPFVTASRAAATKALQAGSWNTALGLLGKAEPHATGDDRVAIWCDQALAAAAAGLRDAASSPLKQIERAKASCPYPAPADTLIVPILRTLVDERDPKRALDRLEKLERRATGVVAKVLVEARKQLGLRAAADAWAAGKIDQARRHVADVRKLGGRPTPELVHAQALLDLEAGKLDAAIAALERIVDDVPEARISLGVAWERKGDAARALAELEKARAEGKVRFKPLDDWIAAKRRVLGTQGSQP